MRDLWRNNTGFTLRRFGVVIRRLPPTSAVWSEVAEAIEKARTPVTNKLEARVAHYSQKREAVTP